MDIDIYNPFNKDNFPSFTPQERSGFQRLLNMGFVDVWRKMNPGIQKFTFWDNRFNMRGYNKGLRIDYFLVSKNFEDKIINSTIQGTVDGSDHCPIVMNTTTDILSE